MKSIVVIFLFLLLAATVTAQKTYVTSMTFSFSGGNEFGSPVGNDCGSTDFVKTVDSTLGIMKLEVNKICHSWSFLQHWMGSPYAQSIVFKNRYIEMRIKSTEPHSYVCSINFQASGGCPPCACSGIPAVYYKIYKPDTWEIKLFQLGGTCDTVFKEVDYNFENGTYYIDYVLYGDAAVPPVPAINKVNDIYYSGELPTSAQYLTLKGICIPARPFDGLVISAKSKNSLVGVSMVKQGDTFVNDSDSTAVLTYTFSKGFVPGSSDSVFVTVDDTIRKTSKTTAFLIRSFRVGSDDINDKIRVYPTYVTDKVTIDFPEAVNAEISILNIYGRAVFSKSLNDSNSTQVDVSGLPAGTYFCRISNGNTIVTKRIIKL